MNKRLLYFFLFGFGVLYFFKGYAQNNTIDSLHFALQSLKTDSEKVNTLLYLSKKYLNVSIDSAIFYGWKAKELADKIRFKQGSATALKNIGIAYYNQGDYSNALNFWNKAQMTFKLINDKSGEANILSNIGAIYYNRGNDERALDYYLKSLQIAEQIHDSTRIATLCVNTGALYQRRNDFVKSSTYYHKGVDVSKAMGDNDILGFLYMNLGSLCTDFKLYDSAIIYLNSAIKYLQNNENLSTALIYLGKALTAKGEYNSGKLKFEDGLKTAMKLDSKLDVVEALTGLGNVDYNQKNYQLSIEKFKQAETIAKEMNLKENLKDIYFAIAKSYTALGDYKNAYKYTSDYIIVKDSIYNLETEKKLNNLQYSFDIKNKEAQINLLQKDKELQQSILKKEKLQKNGIAIGLLLMFIIATVIFRNYKLKSRTNNILNTQNHEINEAYQKLKLTQSQLIHSEKMASLGQLTAGIAHEIQNPLNFVNNFSEINKELIAELKENIEKGDPAEVKAIANEIENNELKIMLHGKRADSIVKGMLQHSMASSGKKELTDINTLIDRTLRLCYQGLRAKDKDFVTVIRTDLNESIGKVNIVPQDISRVLLNFFNNAFYAVDEKKKQLNGTYEPIVSVYTTKLDGKVEIHVKDNGNGIPQKIVDKIFQPFFTTKPTGQGTGLGLSLSYDIIKAHGGEVAVESKEGQETEFVIQLPAN